MDEAGLVVNAIEAAMLRSSEPQDDAVLRSLIFDAGSLARRSDPLAVFFAQDVQAMDWREGFLRDPETDQLIDLLLATSDDEVEIEPEEITYSRADLTTLGSEVMPDD